MYWNLLCWVPCKQEKSQAVPPRASPMCCLPGSAPQNSGQPVMPFRGLVGSSWHGWPEQEATFPLHLPSPEMEACQPKLASSFAELVMQRVLVITWDLWEVGAGQCYSAFGPRGIHVCCKSPVRFTKLQCLVPRCKLLTNCNQHNLPGANVCVCPVLLWRKARNAWPHDHRGSWIQEFRSLNLTWKFCSGVLELCF